jgi:hypothetical protein
VQRILKYPLLLEELVKNFDDTHAAYSTAEVRIYLVGIYSHAVCAFVFTTTCTSTLSHHATMPNTPPPNPQEACRKMTEVAAHINSSFCKPVYTYMYNILYTAVYYLLCSLTGQEEQPHT